ncbi:MAG: hypothetical protein DMF95_27780 [Acidobacteria bacterium]|nr:MAG: hypothetical protein DMF95_27780 [Acidobacteriota bacterium]
MTSRVTRRLIFVGSILTILAVPVTGHAQEATVSGTVTDSTAGVLPGVTIKAVNEASGNNFEAMTDARGAYRIALRIGSYQMSRPRMCSGQSPLRRSRSLRRIMTAAPILRRTRSMGLCPPSIRPRSSSATQITMRPDA